MMKKPVQSSERPRRLRRVLVITALCVVGVIALLLLLAPTIAGSIAPRYAADAINKSINGKAAVQSASFSWFGNQKVGPVTIADDKGERVADLSITVNKGLFSLLGGVAGGGLNIGEITISGSANLVRGPDGRLNVARLARSSPSASPSPSHPGGGAPQPAEPARLPKGLRAAVTIDKLAVQYTDQAAAGGEGGGVYRFNIPSLSGRAAIDGAQASAVLKGAMEYQATPGSSPQPGGTLDINAKVTNLADASGKLTPEAADIDATIEATRIAVAIPDALAGANAKLVQALGERLDATLKAKGSLSAADATLVAGSAALNADLAFQTRDGVLTAPRPGIIAFKSAGARAIVQEALAGQQNITVEQLPDLTLRVADLRLPLPVGGKPLDLRGGAIAVNLESTAASGSVRIPQPDGSLGQAQAYAIAPLKVAIESADLARKIDLRGGTSITIDGQPAGTLALNAAAVDPLDPNGKPRAGMPGRVQGVAELKGLVTALAQPFAEAAGIDLARDVGPRVDLTLRAAAGDGEAEGGATSEAPSAPRPGAAIPPTHLALDIKSANIEAVARLLADDRTISTKPRGVEITVNNVGPFLTRRFRDAGLSVDSATPVKVTIRDLVADLKRLAPAEDGGPDLRAVTGVVLVETGQAAGKLALPDQPPRAFTLAPFSATLDAKDLAQGASLKAATSATLDGAPAGAVAIDLTARNLLDASGAPVKSLPAVSGVADISDISTAIAQPFVESLGLDLPRGVGDRLAIKLVAASKGGASSTPGAIPATDLDLTIKSAGVNSTLALALDGRTIRARDGDGFISIAAPGRLAGKALRDAGLSLTESGYAKLSVRSLAAEFDQGWKPLLDKTATDVEVNIGGMSIGIVPAPSAPGEPSPQPAPPLELRQFIANARLAPGQTPSVDLKSSGSHQQAAFFMQGALQLPGLIGKGPDGAAALTPLATRPLGTLEINNLPTSLVALAAPPASPAPPAQPGSPVNTRPPFDLTRLVRDAVGPTATIKLVSDRPASGSADARDVTLVLTAANFSGSSQAVIDDKAIALSKLDFAGRVNQQLAATFIDMLGSGLASTPTLASPASIRLHAEPFTIPLTDGAPDFARASGNARLKAGIEGKALVNNVVLRSEDGPNRDLGTVGVQDILLTADLPLRALGQGGQPQPADIKLTGAVLGSADRRIIDLTGGASTLLASGRPQGDMRANVSLKLLDPAWVDTFLGQPGLLAGALGGDASIQADAAVKFPPNGSTPAGSEAAASPPPPPFQSAAINASLTSERMRTTQPLKATLLPDRLSVDAPMVLRWTVDPAWANARLLTPADPKAGPPPVAFAAPAELTVSVFKLAVFTGPDGGPLKPGIFLADAAVESPGTTFNVGHGAQARPSRITNLKARITGGKDPGTLGFSLTVDDLGGGRSPDGKPAVNFAGGVYGVSDAAGELTTDAARITMNGAAHSVPTIIVDALAQQGGLVAEALGPTANLDVQAQGLSRQGGNLNVVAVSPRAEATLKGFIRDGAFVSAGATEFKLKEITPALGGMLTRNMPTIGSFEKRPEDGPAVVRASGLTVPIDGDLTKLNGQVVFDLGTARFSTSNVFQKLLKFTGQKEAGTLGRHLKPITVRLTNGVANYDKITIPLGEFEIATRGDIDLANKRLDVVTYIPLGALTDEAAGLFNTGAGSLLGKVPILDGMTLMPFRTTGSFDKNDTRPDLELFGKEVIQNLRPDKAVGNILEDLLKKGKDK